MGTTVIRAGLLLSLLAAPACAGQDDGPAAASCPAPTIRPATEEVAAGGRLTVEGSLFRACYDTGQEGTPPPSTDVALVLRQGGEAFELGVEDARGGGSITWDVEVPTTVTPGRARLLAGGASAGIEVGGQDQGLPAGDAEAPPVSAVCEAPSIAVEGSGDVTPGGQVTLTGRAFLATCNDTGQGVPDRPRQDVTLTLRQNGRSYDLVTLDAERDGSFVVEVVLPDELEAGRAVLLTDRVAQVEVTVDG